MSQLADSCAASETTVRLFVAVDLPDRARSEVRDIQRHLESVLVERASLIRWVTAANAHLTLQYLGDTIHPLVPKIESALGSAASRHRAFSLRLQSLGAFPNLRSAPVLWAGLDGDMEELRHLQTDIAANLMPLGFVSDNSFSPHITLGRARGTARVTVDRNYFEGLGSRMRDGDHTTFEVRFISLICSTLTGNGAVYRTIAELPLTDGKRRT